MKIDDIRNLSLQVSRETGVPVKKILDLIYALKSGQPIENNKLLSLLGLSKNSLNMIKSKLSHYLKPATKDTQAVTPIADLFQVDYEGEERLWTLLDNDIYKKSKDILTKYEKLRPSPNRNYDQFTATIETTAKRTSLLNFFEDIKGKNILFLGDDDFTSVTVSNLNEATNVSVLDIDNRITNNIKAIAEKENLKINTYISDIRNEIPLPLVNKFDVVFTDPPYTTEGIELFLSRAIQSLDKNNNSGRIYLCYGNSDRAKERFLPIYDVINKFGLMTRWVFDKFNRYNGAESIGSSSSLLILDVTDKTKPTIVKEYEKPIYTNN